MVTESFQMDPCGSNPNIWPVREEGFVLSGQRSDRRQRLFLRQPGGLRRAAWTDDLAHVCQGRESVIVVRNEELLHLSPPTTDFGTPLVRTGRLRPRLPEGGRSSTPRSPPTADVVGSSSTATSSHCDADLDFLLRSFSAPPEPGPRRRPSPRPHVALGSALLPPFNCPSTSPSPSRCPGQDERRRDQSS